ncbi:MAG: HAD family hydrolase [Anaerolineales bacterium]|jgi:FMN phosphatase YigB (HAD superfamily)
MGLRKIDTVLFDLDGTLRFSDPPSIDTFHRHAEVHGIQPDPDSQRAARRWVSAYWANSDELLKDMEIFGNHPDNGAFWTNHARKHLMILGGSEGQAEQLAPEITRIMQEQYDPVGVVAADAFETLGKLQEDGYRLGVVSNRQKPIQDVIEELDLQDFFEIILAAGEVGWWKPDPRLLTYAAELMQTPPEAIAYVGDNFYADVISAEGAGMRAVLVDPLGLFPEAECTVIQKLGELDGVLNTNGRIR